MKNAKCTKKYCEIFKFRPEQEERKYVKHLIKLKKLINFCKKMYFDFEALQLNSNGLEKTN